MHSPFHPLTRSLTHSLTHALVSQEAYKLFDVNDDGLVEYEEFVNGMHALELGLSDKQLYELMSSIDVDRDSSISFDEFAVRAGVSLVNWLRQRRDVRCACICLLRMCVQARFALVSPPSDDEWVRGELSKVCPTLSGCSWFVGGVVSVRGYIWVLNNVCACVFVCIVSSAYVHAT
jgi:EF-hand domain pair